MLIDSHVNLHAPQFDEDREAVISRALAAGVRLMVNICDKVSNYEAVRLVAQHPDIWCTVGTHPHEAKEDPALSAETLVAIAADRRVVGIGECGLDFHYDFSPRDILEEEHARGAFRILMHCYTSGPELARRVAALGAWFSVSGIATFRAAEDVRAVIREMPSDRIMVETDCPYLAPVPYRGRRNEPAMLPHVLAKLADIRGWDLAEAEARTADAFFAVFDRIPRP
jgi:TatD DNase family protein